MSAKKAVLLVNVGTPERDDVPSVRRFLSRFLNDRRVIDLPWLLQKILVNGIIVPFRAKGSTKLYRRLWTEEGSPILLYLNGLSQKVQDLLGDDYQVFPTMRYGKPSLKEALKTVGKDRFEELIVLPLFPQYASSTAGSVVQYVMNEVKSWNTMPEIRFVGQFYKDPGFLTAFTNQIKSYNPEKYDHVIFSYHGLPLRQIDRVHPEMKGLACSCTAEMPAHGTLCYKATCYETSRLLAKQSGIDRKNYTVAFQSRLSKNWLEPFTDAVLKKLITDGKKKVLVVSPAFVADCLETTVEIGMDYKELFLKLGGEELVLVESLNDNDDWAKAVVSLIDKGA
ncbi:MAG: ferrochelatase [Bacteroidales bacterium]|nr:ferrochelatase [Bacteroidales bacterium]